MKIKHGDAVQPVCGCLLGYAQFVRFVWQQLTIWQTCQMSYSLSMCQHTQILFGLIAVYFYSNSRDIALLESISQIMCHLFLHWNLYLIRHAQANPKQIPSAFTHIENNPIARYRNQRVFPAFNV